MARPGIGYDDVKTAAIQLLGQGINPSIQKVREVLGTGSNSTIAEHLKRWQQAMSEAPKVILPPAVPETVGAAFAQFWQVAVEQAEMGYQAQREHANQTVVSAERARDEAIEEMERAYKETKALEQRVEHLEANGKEQEKQRLIEAERRLQAERSIDAAEQGRREALRTIETIRSETETRIAQIAENFRQLREDSVRQLSEAQRQLQFERERNQANEAKLMGILDQNRTEFGKERKGFLDEQKQLRTRELDLRTQWEKTQQDLVTSRMTVVSLEERARSLNEEISLNRKAQETQRIQQLEAIRAIEASRSELKTAEIHRNKLEEELQALRSGLQTYMPFPAPA